MLNLVVDSIHDETDRIRVFTLCEASGAELPGYLPGAHLDFDLGELGTRSYSLIDWKSSLSTRNYTIAVQREDDGTGGSKAMHRLEAGRAIKVLPPENDFELRDGAAPVLLLAGGIGVTPLISMASALDAQARDFAFHYSARSAGVMGFRERLGQAFPDHMVFHFDDQAPLDLAKLMSAQPPDTQLYICGPKGMIDAAREAAITAGLAEANIHIELFSAPEAQSGDASFEVEIHDTGEVFVIPAGKTIIEVLEEAGKDLMYDCQRGDCGICQTDVISGTPDHRDVVLSEADRAAGKVMQICVSRAKSGRLVLDL
ncbi:PDR/VanB family oxidoreductase [Hoeflea prorocentri]|uniref:PDR/VanB family oxidoreductase n=1 Tax=Hoeflea prorocentri TaxID=1922333 RepID=A0A9X3UIU1_9HYPH|nr:PDR/VanB family oxidoreductase [Hoeflea prorocentri]MCY6379430.1 PDR/VanB family oxidoreductase [Hoeflea prorocentri]MDA5397231.1 PDR/VanB family oxidoreductase [Hoeflea prorocentri]